MDLLQKCDKEYQKINTGFWNKIFSNSNNVFKMEDLGSDYHRAGILLRIEKDNDNAIQAFEKALEIYRGLELESKQNDCYIDLVKCHDNSDKLIDYYTKIIKYYTNSNSLYLAAKYYELLAAVYKDYNEDKLYIDTLSMANNLYKMTDMFSKSRNILMLLIIYYIEKDDLVTSLQYYQEIISYNTDKIYFVSSYHLEIALIKIANDDLIGAETHVTLCDYHHSRLLSKFIESVVQDDLEAFTTVCKSYDENKRIAPYMIIILNKIKNKIKNEDLC